MTEVGGGRRSGRTTQQLHMAIDRALEGRPVFFISHCERSCAVNMERCRDILIQLGIPFAGMRPPGVLSLLSGGSIRFWPLEWKHGAIMRPSFETALNRDSRFIGAGAELRRFGRIIVDHHAWDQIDRDERKRRDAARAGIAKAGDK